VDTIHLTGSRATYDAIAGQKPITAELGCVTPILVVPGNWSRSDLRRQAMNIAGMVTFNASFNCNAGKVLILDKGWNQREALLEEIQAALAAAPQRYPYYPGAEDRYARYLEAYPSAIQLGDQGSTSIPWTFIPGVKPDPGEYALRVEPFCGVLSEVSMEGNGDPEAFLNRAVSFANRSIEGDLSCMVISDRKSPIDEAILNLRYGGIAVNAWTGMNYGLGNTHWGAAPGNTPDAIGSGTGSVHNSFLFDNPEKSVVYAPFRAWPKPVWFPDHRTLPNLGRALARYEDTGSPVALLNTFVAALFA
jgi:acyl-CoA reductase-like NAD-dependent aldehyde dehydrogenase